MAEQLTADKNRANSNAKSTETRNVKNIGNHELGDCSLNVNPPASAELRSNEK